MTYVLNNTGAEVQRDMNEGLGNQPQESIGWDDLRFPLSGQRLDTSSGRVDYNYTDCTVDFADDARYPNEPICFVAQMPHSKKADSDMRIHVHWLQNQNATPNILLEYWSYNNGEDESLATRNLVALTTNEFTYNSETSLGQISYDGFISIANETVSAMLKMRLFRDSANTSGLFAGTDTYTGNWQVDELDVHYQQDQARGSRQEFVK